MSNRYDAYIQSGRNIAAFVDNDDGYFCVRSTHPKFTCGKTYEYSVLNKHHNELKESIKKKHNL